MGGCNGMQSILVQLCSPQSKILLQWEQNFTSVVPGFLEVELMNFFILQMKSIIEINQINTEN